MLLATNLLLKEMIHHTETFFKHLVFRCNSINIKQSSLLGLLVISTHIDISNCLKNIVYVISIFI